MSQILVVSDEKYDELRKLLSQNVTVIMKESVAKKHGIEDGDERFKEYTCEGDTEVWVEFIGDDNHFALLDVVGVEE